MLRSNKEIQEERIKRYFVEATKKILKGEGLKSVNVRNIAREAGYSYATLYNYFKDVKELVFQCVKDFQIECADIVKLETTNSRRGKQRITAITLSYIKFFVQYPGIFELFYLERVNDIGYKSPTMNLVYCFFDELCEAEWNYCIEKKIYSHKDVELLKLVLRNSTVGILLFYLNRYQPSDYSEFVELARKQLNGILK